MRPWKVVPAVRRISVHKLPMMGIMGGGGSGGRGGGRVGKAWGRPAGNVGVDRDAGSSRDEGECPYAGKSTGQASQAVATQRLSYADHHQVA